MNPPQVLSGVPVSPPKRRATPADVFAVLFLLAALGLGIVVMFQGLTTDRRQLLAETPESVISAPPHVFYDPADRQRLNSEIAGCVLTLIVLAFGCWRLRRRPPELRLERLPAAKLGEVREKWIAPPAHTAEIVAKLPRRPPTRRPTSRSIAAERLSAVVWSDQLARQGESA